MGVDNGRIQRPKSEVTQRKVGGKHHQAWECFSRRKRQECGLVGGSSDDHLFPHRCGWIILGVNYPYGTDWRTVRFLRIFFSLGTDLATAQTGRHACSSNRSKQGCNPSAIQVSNEAVTG